MATAAERPEPAEAILAARKPTKQRLGRRRPPGQRARPNGALGPQRMGVRTAGARQNLTGPKPVLKGAAPSMNTTTSTPAPVPGVWERHYLFSPGYLAVLTKVDTGGAWLAGRVPVHRIQQARARGHRASGSAP